MKAAVVTKNHTVDIQDKVLRPLKHGEAALKMECCGVPHRFAREKRRFRRGAGHYVGAWGWPPPSVRASPR